MRFSRFTTVGVLTRYLRYNQRSRRFIRWLLMYSWREVPARPRRVPHFHINLLPEAPESVYLSTVIKNLETADPLSAYSRARE